MNTLNIKTKSEIDSKIVELLNTCLVEVSNVYLNDPARRAYTQHNMWDNALVLHFAKINMLYADPYYSNRPDIALEMKWDGRDDELVSDAWIRDLFTKVFCEYFKADDTDVDEMVNAESWVDGIVCLDLEKLTEFFRCCDDELHGLTYTKWLNYDNNETSFDTIRRRLINKELDEYGFFINGDSLAYGSGDDCFETGVIEFCGDNYDNSPLDDEMYSAIKYYFSKYIWDSLQGHVVKYIDLLKSQGMDTTITK